MSAIDSEELLYNILRFAFAGGLLIFLAVMVRVMLKEIDTATRDVVEHGNEPPSVAWLMVVDGGSTQLASGQSLMIQDRATIGRAPECDVVFDDPSVSSVHAVIYLNADHWLIEDYESMNGTFAEGEPVFAPTGISDGDLLQFGRVRARMLC